MSDKQYKDYYFYVSNIVSYEKSGKRILKVVPFSHLHEPVDGFTHFIINCCVEDDIFYHPWKYVFDFHLQNFIYKIEDEMTTDTYQVIFNEIKKLNILIKFNTAASFYKYKYIKRGQLNEIYNFFLVEEINNYKDNKQEGDLLKALVKASKYDSVEILISVLEMQFIDTKQIFTYYINKQYELQSLLDENKFDEASKIVQDEILRSGLGN